MPYEPSQLSLRRSEFAPFLRELKFNGRSVTVSCFIKESCIEMELGTMASSPEYKFHTPTIEFASFGDPPKTYSCCTLTIKCSRKWHGFAWRVIYPLASLTLFSLAAFFYEITDFSSRLSFLITLILSIIAFQFVVMSSVPPIPYVSQADIYVIQSLAFLSCIILYVCIIQKYLIISASNPSYVQLIDARFGIAFFAAWVLMQIIYILQARSKYLASLPLLNMSYSELMDQELLAAPYELLSLPSKSVRILYEEEVVEDKEKEKEKDKEMSVTDASGTIATATTLTQPEQALAKAKIVETNKEQDDSHAKLADKTNS